MRDWDDDRLIDDVPARQAGLPIPGVEVSIRDDDGDEVAFDGETMGALHVRGPWVTDRLPARAGRGELHRRRLVQHR